MPRSAIKTSGNQNKRKVKKSFHLKEDKDQRNIMTKSNRWSWTKKKKKKCYEEHLKQMTKQMWAIY